MIAIDIIISVGVGMVWMIIINVAVVGCCCVIIGGVLIIIVVVAVVGCCYFPVVVIVLSRIIGSIGSWKAYMLRVCWIVQESECFG